VLDAEVFMANISTWVAGYSTRSSGLLACVVARRGSANACGWAVWGMCMVWVVA
jgi:hypothetical protein